MIQIGAIIMASGFSKRFGQQNKLMMPLKGDTVIEAVVARVVASDVASRIVIVTQFDEIEEIYKDNNQVMVVRNAVPEEGISSTMKIGIRALGPVDGYMFIPGDQIGLTTSSIQAIAEGFKRAPDKILVPTYDGAHGSPKVFPSAYKDKLLSLRGDTGGKQLINDNLDKIVLLPLQAGDNLDIDTEVCYRKVKGDN